MRISGALMFFINKSVSESKFSVAGGIPQVNVCVISGVVRVILLIIVVVGNPRHVATASRLLHVASITQRRTFGLSNMQLISENRGS